MNEELKNIIKNEIIQKAIYELECLQVEFEDEIDCDDEVDIDEIIFELNNIQVLN